MGCLCSLATSVVRILVFVFNFLLVLLGLTLLTMGILYKLKVDSFINFTKSHDISVAPTMCIILGTLLFIISFFGCCGALKQNSCMLRTWAVILMVILVLELVGCYYAFKYLNDDAFEKDVVDQFQQAVEDYYEPGSDQKLVDNVQIQLHCCGGVNGPKDFNGNIPKSCCGLESDSKEVCNSNDIYQDGCTTFIKDVIDQIGQVLGSIAIVGAAVLIAGAFFGCCLSCR